MMMQILEAAGVRLLCDGVRKADDDNPRGYYEYEPVKRLADDASWLSQARGKAVKIVSPLLRQLPPGEHYRVILMLRDLDEVLASQHAMIKHRGQQDELSDHELREAYQAHLDDIRAHLRRAPAFETKVVHHRQLLESPRWLQTLADWLPTDLGVERLEELGRLVDPRLYRSRAPARKPS